MKKTEAMGDILIQSFVNIRLWDIAQWSATVCLLDPTGWQPSGLGIVFNNIAIGKEIFSRWRQYLGKTDVFEELRIAIIEGDIAGEHGYSVHISSDPLGTMKHAEADGRQLDVDSIIVGGRVNRIKPGPYSPFLNMFKVAFHIHNRYFLVPVAKSESGEMVPHFEYAVEKQSILFKPVEEVTDTDTDAIVFAPKDCKSWVTVKDDLSDQLAQLRKARAVSLRDIQTYYFAMLDRFVGQLYSEMERTGVSPHDIAQDISSRKELVREFLPALEDYLLLAREFWDSFGDTVREHVRKLSCLKSVFGGDISPSYVSNVASSVGLYMDTIVLPDPLIKTIVLSGVTRPGRLLYYTIKHALNILSYRELALADVEPPVVVIVPDYVGLDELSRQAIEAVANEDMLYHSGKLFGKTFPTTDALGEFLSQFDHAGKLTEALAEPGRLLLDAEWQGSIGEQLKRYVDDTLENFGRLPSSGRIGDIVGLQITGRMQQMNEILLKSMSCDGTPLITAPTSWQYLLWKYEYDRERSTHADSMTMDLVISKALQSRGKKEIKLLSDLPFTVLLDLRRNGALSGFREVLRVGIGEMASAGRSDLAEVAEAVAVNINQALTKHEVELDDLAASKKRFFGKDVTRWITFGTVSMVAASTGNTLLSLVAAAAGLIGSKGGPELWKEAKDISSKERQLKRSPVALFFKHLRTKKYSIADRYQSGK